MKVGSFLFLAPYTLWSMNAYAQCAVMLQCNDASIISGESTTINASGATTFHWSPADGLDVTAGEVVTASPSETTTYTATGICQWTIIDAGFAHTMGIRWDGTLWVWGANGSGQLGTGTTDPSTIPVQIGTDNDWISIAAGNYHSIALKSNGTLYGWGENTAGQLGIGTTGYELLPVQLGDDDDWTAVSTASKHSIAMKMDGSLWACGENTHGQLGDGTFEPSLTWQQVGDQNDWLSFSSQGFHTLAIRSNGTLWSWGNNDYGQLGAELPSQNMPVQIGTDADWQSVSAGYYFSFGIKTDGTLWGWGNNYSNQLGIAEVGIESVPVQIFDFVNCEKASGGFNHSLVLLTNGEVWGWGRNQEGQLALGNNTDQPTPLFIANDMGLIAADNEFSFFQGDETELMASGINDVGQLGLGLIGAQNTMVAVSGGSSSSLMTIEVGLSVSEYVSTASWQVFPNPTDDYVTLQCTRIASSFTYALHDCSGRKLLEGRVTSATTRIETNAITSGAYFLRLKSEDENLCLPVIVR